MKTTKIGVKLHDSYNDEVVMDVETKECFRKEHSVCCDEERVYLYSCDISFNCAYVGSAEGETFWVKRGIVVDSLGENFSLNDFLAQDWGEDKHWVDFGFKEIADLDDYVIVCGDWFLDLDDFDSACMSEDLV